MKLQVIKLESGSSELDAFRKKMEKIGLADRLKKMNNERCRVAGMTSPQGQPLPALFENVRAFFLRLGDRFFKKRDAKRSAVKGRLKKASPSL